MGYFITQQEISNKNKNVYLALALTLFVGIFGVHRFYFRRYVSGSIILAGFFLTAGQGLWITIPIIIVELLKFTDISDRDRKMRAQIRHAAKSQRDAYTREATAQIIPETYKNINKVTIHNISDIETSQIQPRKGISAPSSQDTRWVKRLEIPYERSDLSIPQLRKTTYMMFEKLADRLDRQLQETGSSLDRLLHQIRLDSYSYYDNLLYTIFCIAEGEISRHYSGGYSGYDNSFSYDLLERRIGLSQTKSLQQYAMSLTKSLPPADIDTRKHFRLTDNGLPVVWWDKDGSLRASHKISDIHMRILKNTPSRNTKIYEITEVRGVIFTQYLKVVSILNKQRQLSSGWSQRMTKYLDQVFSNDREWVNNPHNVMILSHLLKLSEQAVRASIPYSRPLDVSKELASVRRIIPKDVATILLETVNNIDPPKLSEATLDLLRSQNPTAWKHDIVDIELASTEKVIMLLNRYSQSSTISKVAKEIIKKHDDKEVKLLALYQVSIISGTLDQQLNRHLRNLIHEAQASAFTDLVAQKKKLSISLGRKLVTLQNPPRKRVVLDEQKLFNAHNEHQRAVSSVIDYLGNEEDEVQQAIVNPSPTITQEIPTTTSTKNILLEDHQKEFIRLIIYSDKGFEAHEASQYVKDQKKMLNGYIQTINKKLFSLFNDQVIIQRDGIIEVDEEYLTTVKDLL